MNSSKKYLEDNSTLMCLPMSVVKSRKLKNKSPVNGVANIRKVRSVKVDRKVNIYADELEVVHSQRRERMKNPLKLHSHAHMMSNRLNTRCFQLRLHRVQEKRCKLL